MLRWLVGGCLGCKPWWLWEYGSVRQASALSTTRMWQRAQLKTCVTKYKHNFTGFCRPTLLLVTNISIKYIFRSWHTTLIYFILNSISGHMLFGSTTGKPLTQRQRVTSQKTRIVSNKFSHPLDIFIRLRNLWMAVKTEVYFRLYCDCI
jgi:hypothetical protein